MGALHSTLRISRSEMEITMKKGFAKTKYSLVKTIAGGIVIGGLFLGLLSAATGYFEKTNRAQELALTEQAIKKAVLTCYAIEGMYPSELSYLVENYRLKIDEEKYFVSYDCFASNIMPAIYVFER